MKISNQFLEASFKASGAEITSLKKEDSEYIWQGDTAHWNRHAPVLFPFVGKLKDNHFVYQDRPYEVGQHGFARDLEFEVLEHGQEDISFLLKSTVATLRKYPFEFELRISYHLHDSSLITTYQVSNVGSEQMYFSIGGHPAFNCPMTDHEERSDYWLKFDHEENLTAHLLTAGTFTGETEVIPMKEDKLIITDNLFDKDALVFKGLRSEEVSLESPEGKWLTFHFKGFPYLGIWSKSNVSPFVCIEPWFGLADNQQHNGDLTTKEGINHLAIGQSFSTSYKVEIH